MASQGKYQPQHVIFKMNMEAAVITKRVHRKMAQGSKKKTYLCGILRYVTNETPFAIV